ncbi:MAG: extracellular solute-binding protein [Oscillospiraceae bacterium]|nr:extracellular solute-binding protein [Oscillospiraceae bacterium]
MKKANRLITILIFIFLYIPMAVLIVASFNTGKDITQFSGFTLKQYAELFRDRDLLALLGNSILISVLASGISTVFGTISAVGIYRMKPRMRSFVMNLTNIPMTNPDIVTGISLSLLFVFIGSKMLGQRDALNFWTLLIAHITFSLPYIILNVMPKLQQMDPALTDAAMDLGCTPVKSFFKVTLPEIMPGVVAGAIMAFTMSLDDFVISYFVSGNDFITLPVEIYTYTKKPIQPKLYAMFTLLFLLIFVLMVTMNLLQIRAEKDTSRRKKDARLPKWAKAVISCVVAFAILVPVGFGIYQSQQKTVLYVSNWGQNIADGSDETLDIIAEFERRYPHIDVKYSTYDSNESLYSKLSAGGTPVDVIIPSDYMIARLAAEGQLMELNFDNIPNFSKVDDRFKNPDYDPENQYSVPYTWGTVGILYNEKYVDPADVTGWEVLWNEKYEGKILMFDNSRDAFGIAQYMLGYSVNTTDKAELQACADLLTEQKPLVQQYVMDQIYAAMQDEEAYIAPYYAGDCMCMMQENENLRFYLPENQGFNAFVDAMCVPTCCQNQEAAELFINFMCDPEISGANMDYIWYGSPITEARGYMDEVLATSPVVYPDEEILTHGTSYGFLPEDISRYVESLFMKVRNS